MKPGSTALKVLISFISCFSTICLASESKQSHYMSGLIGTGFAVGKERSQPVLSLHTTGSFRLMFDLKMEERFLWGLDLDWLRIRQRQDTVFSQQLDAEGLGLLGGYRRGRLSYWAKLGGGRIHARAKAADGQELISRYPYYQSALGISWAFYRTPFVWIEAAGSMSWLRAGGGNWRSEIAPKNIALGSFLIAVKFFDL